MHSSLKLQDSSHNAAAICTMTSSSSEPADITAQQALLFDLQSSNALQPAVQGSNFTAQPLQLSLPDQVAIRPQLQMIQSQVPAVREMLQQALAQQGALSMQQIHSAVMQTPAVPLELYSIHQQLAQHYVLAQQPQSAVPDMLFGIQQHLGQQHLVQQLLMQQVSAMQRPALRQLDQQQLPLQQASNRQHAPAVAPTASRRQQVVQRVPPVLPGKGPHEYEPFLAAWYDLTDKPQIHEDMESPTGFLFRSMAYRCDGAAVAPIMTRWLRQMLGYWQDQEYGVHYYQWTKDQRSLLFPLVHCFQRWGLIDPGFAAAIKRTSPEKEPLVQIKIVMRDHSGIGPPEDARSVAGPKRGLDWYGLMYCGAAGFDCTMCLKFGGRMVDVAYPNFQSALSGNEYSYVYALQTSANSIAEKNTGSKVPLQRDTNYFVPPTTTCAAEHGRAAKQLGLKDRFEPSRMRKDDAHALQQLQSAHTGQLHAPSAVSAAQARPHASMLNAGPAATQSNKVSIWAAARSGASQQSQAAAMTDFHLHLQQQHAEERRQMGLSNRVVEKHTIPPLRGLRFDYRDCEMVYQSEEQCEAFFKNALDALDQGNEPKIGVDFSGNCCGLYEEGRVNKMFMTMPKYGLPKGASRKGIAPLHVAVGASTKANTAATKRMLATAVEGVQKVFGETAIQLFRGAQCDCAKEILQALCQTFCSGKRLATYLREFLCYLVHNPGGDASAFFILTIDIYHPMSASRRYSIAGLKFMPGTSPQAQQLQRLLTKFSLWEMMQSTNVQHLFECMAALVCCCDAQMLQLDPAAPLPSSSKTPEYVLAVVQGRGSTAPGMTDDEVDTAISCNEEAATEAATEAEKPGTAAIAADGEGEKEEDQPDVAAGIQDDIFDASWERRLPMEGLGNGCYVLARLVKDEELVLEHQIPEVR